MLFLLYTRSHTFLFKQKQNKRHLNVTSFQFPINGCCLFCKYTIAWGRLLGIAPLGSRGKRPPQSSVGGVKGLRQRERSQVLASDRTFLLLFLPPLITLG